jgi:hypothetical protein
MVHQPKVRRPPLPSTATTNQSPQPILDLILADINAIVPNFSSLVSSYRLLVGAAEEIHRTPDTCPDVFERAVKRYDNAGTIIDVLLELLCCKIAFSSDFLQISCAPVDLFRLLANRTIGTDTPFHTAEQVVEMEALRRILEGCHPKHCCLPDNEVVCPPTTPLTPPPPPPIVVSQPSTDIAEVEAAALSQLINKANKPRGKAVSSNIPPPLPLPATPEAISSASPIVETIPLEKLLSESQSRVRCKHLNKVPNKNTKSKHPRQKE